MNYRVHVLLVVLMAAQIAYGFVPARFGARAAARGLSAIDQVGKVLSFRANDGSDDEEEQAKEE